MSVDIAFTPPGAIYPKKLAKELRAVMPGFHSVTVDDDTHIAAFDAAFTAEEQTQFDDIVAAHDPAKEPVRKLIAPATLIRQEVSVANETEWEAKAGVIASPEFFAPGERLQQVVGHVLGQFFCVGGGAEIRLTEDIYGAGQSVLAITADYTAVETQGTWQILSFFTSRPPASGANLYELQARRNGAADLKIRNTSMSLFELVQ